MYRLAVITIGVTLVILPFANAITGPITAPSNNSNVTSRLSYCNRNYTDAVLHSDSLARLPASVWIVLIVIFGVNIVGRYVRSFRQGTSPHPMTLLSNDFCNRVLVLLSMLAFDDGDFF